MIMWFSFVSTTSQLKEQLSETNLIMLNQLDQRIVSMLKDVDKRVIGLANERPLRAFMDNHFQDDTEKYSYYADLSKLVSNLAFSNSYTYSVYLYSEASKHFITNTSSETENNFYDKLWKEDFDSLGVNYKWLSTRKVIESESQNFPIYHNLITLVRSYPLNVTEGFRRGEIVVNLDENAFYKLVTQVNGNRPGYTLIIDRDGKIISHNDKQYLYGNVSEEEYGKMILSKQGGEGQFQSSVNGVPSMVFYTSSSYTGWKYVSIVPDVQLTGGSAKWRHYLLIVAVMLFAFTVLAVIIASTWIYKPIDQGLQRVFQRLKSSVKADKKTVITEELSGIEYMVDHMLVANEKMQQQIHQSIPVLKWRVLFDLLTGNKVADKRFSLLNFRLESSHYIVMVADFDRRSEMAGSRDLSLYAYALCNVAEEMINSEGKGEAIVLTDNRIVMILSFAENEPSSNQILALSLSEQIKSYVAGHFKQTISIGVGGFYVQMEEIHQSFNEASSSLQYRMLMGNDIIISYEEVADIHTAPSIHVYRMYGLIDQIADAVKAQDMKAVERHLRQFFDDMTRHLLPEELIRQLCLQLMMKAIQIVGSCGIEKTEWQPLTERIYDTLQKISHVENMHTYMAEQLQKLISLISAKRATFGKNEMILKVTAFIEERYMIKELSLNMLASHFQISVPYLSKLFKDHTGQNFLNYLIDIRMREAKRLLEDTTKTVSEIADRIGYTNYSSFIRIFKKYTGITPGEYRETVMSERLNRAAGTAYSPPGDAQ
jgi:AraC-like DNA-binding protein